MRKICIVLARKSSEGKPGNAASVFSLRRHEAAVAKEFASGRDAEVKAGGFAPAGKSPTAAAQHAAVKILQAAEQQHDDGDVQNRQQKKRPGVFMAPKNPRQDSAEKGGDRERGDGDGDRDGESIGRRTGRIEQHGRHHHRDDGGQSRQNPENG